MTTAATLIARSLRLIQVIDARQPVAPQDMQTSIEALNDMLQRWEANQLSLGWQDVKNPSDKLPIPREARRPIAYCLAVEIAPEFGTEASPTVMRRAVEGLNDLLRDQMVATPIRPFLGAPIPDNWSIQTINGASWYVG